MKEGAGETDLGWIPQFNIFDRLGSVVFEYNVIENSQGLHGGVFKVNQYTPFGQAITYDDKPEDRTGYINKDLDTESNLADHGVRKYDNTIGRFITPDALWEKYYACRS